MAQDDAFKQGLQARGDKKWTDVVRQMQVAVKADSQESTRKVRSGFLNVNGMEYLPHFFMGEALFNLKDCAGAVNEWTISEQQSAIKSRREFIDVMRSGYRECAAKGVLPPSEYNPLYVSTRTAYAEVAAQWKRVSDLSTTHKDIWRSDMADQLEKARRELETSQTRLTAGTRTRSASDFAESKAAADRSAGILRPLELSLNSAIETLTSVQKQSTEIEQIIDGADATDREIETIKASLTDGLTASRRSGREQLAQARDRLTAAQKTPSPSTVGDALKFAQTASTTLSQVLDQAKKLARGVFEQQFGDAIKAADAAFSRVSAAMATLDRRAKQKPELVQPQMTSDRAALQKQIDSLRRRFERARRTEDLAALTDTTRLTLEAQTGLDGLIRAFGPMPLRDRGIHAALEDGARQFLDGEYQKAVDSLATIANSPDVPLKLHVHLFNAASLYALFVRSGETNQQLKAQAFAEILRCKELDASFQPDPRVFAPRFLAAYRGTIAAPAAASQ